MTSPQKNSLQSLYPKRLDIPFLTLLSAGLLATGLSMPVLTVRKLWEAATFSIWTGILNMWHEKEHFLAIIVFFFSIVFPIAKLMILLLTWFIDMKTRDRKQLLHFLGLLGKWSMLDVFVTAVILVSLKLGALASAEVETGLYVFAASVLLAMFVTGQQNKLARV